MRFIFLICCACLVFANEILLLSKFDKQDFNSKDFNAYLMSENLMECVEFGMGNI